MSPEAHIPQVPTPDEYEASADELARLSSLVVRFEAKDGEPSMEEGATMYTEHKIRHSELRTTRDEALGMRR